jgi:hypothetical protein
MIGRRRRRTAGMGHATATVKDALESTHQNFAPPNDVSRNAKVALETPQEENHNLDTGVRHCARANQCHAACADAPPRED